MRVTDRVYCATGYAISNILYVICGTSVVVIDTTESMTAARASFDEFRNICSLPVSHIIYTHFHGDHIRGAKVFHTPQTRVIGHKKLPEEVAYVGRMFPYRRRVTALQFGFKLKPEDRGARLLNEPESGYVPPDVLVEEQYQFREGNFSFELYHTEGETVDHLMIWIPEEMALFPGDLYYSAFPMLSNPMRPDRPILGWAESLERMRKFRPKYLIPSHGKPVAGAEEIDSALANYARAIRFVHDETVERINAGLTLDEIRREVKLPEDLASLPYLEETYGRVTWAVNGVFRQHTGWYTFNPSDLNPGRRDVLQRVLVEVAGGPAGLVARARKALREGEVQLVLELTDVVLGARPNNQAAHQLRVQALRRLGNASQNRVERNIYLTSSHTNGGQQPIRLVRHQYAGVWMRPAQAPSAKPDASADLTAMPEGVQLRQKTARMVNEWYNGLMYRPAMRQRYGGSDFHNFGYWTAETKSQQQACENLMEMLLAFVPVKEGTILDVACGKGATTRFLLNYYRPCDVTGINISEKQLDTCRTNAPECRFLLMDATDLRFEDCSFDNIICVEAAFHFVTRAKFIAEAYRVLKPGGRLVLSDILPIRRLHAARFFEGRVIPAPEYGDYYFKAGFEKVEIIDASEECNLGHRDHALSLLRREWRLRKINWQTFQKRMAGAKQRHEGYYLLVCAHKGLSDASDTNRQSREPA